MTLSYESSISKLKQVIGEVTGVSAKRVSRKAGYNRSQAKILKD